MGCTYTIVVYGHDRQALSKTVNAALDEVDRLDRLMSHYKPESPLSRINREAAQHPVKVDRELFDFLGECLSYSRESFGAFDITVGPLMKAWGFFRGEGRMPSKEELAEARSKLGYQHVTLNKTAQTVSFDKPGVELDLGGIGKGYAVDCAAKILKQQGIQIALISAGGSTIYGIGAPPESSDGWELMIQDPLDHEKIATKVLLKNRVLSVSGSYEKFFELEGKRYSHIMDPRTGWPVPNMLSVAVLTENGTAGDALDNVFYVLGIEASKIYLRKLPNTQVIFFLPDQNKRWQMIQLKGPKQ